MKLYFTCSDRQNSETFQPVLSLCTLARRCYNLNVTATFLAEISLEEIINEYLFNYLFIPIRYLEHCGKGTFFRKEILAERDSCLAFMLLTKISNTLCYSEACKTDCIPILMQFSAEII